MPFVSITRLRVRDPEFLELFFADAIAADEQARAAAGNLGAELLAEPTNAYWTKTAWTDRAAMRAFMTSGPHAGAMPRLR
ncbi:MAG: antibiotic biosynthesis monooxygenase, partial [Acidimicrobiales bacterium]